MEEGEQTLIIALTGYNKTCYADKDCKREWHFVCTENHCLCPEGYTFEEYSGCQADVAEVMITWVVRLIVASFTFLICFLLLYSVLKQVPRCSALKPSTSQTTSTTPAEGAEENAGERSEVSRTVSDSPPRYSEAVTPPPTYDDVAKKGGFFRWEFKSFRRLDRTGSHRSAASRTLSRQTTVELRTVEEGKSLVEGENASI